MIAMSEDYQLKILEYSLSILADSATNNENTIGDTTATSISKMELQSTLNVYNIILNEFSNPGEMS